MQVIYFPHFSYETGTYFNLKYDIFLNLTK